MSKSELLSLLLFPGQTPFYIILLVVGYFFGPKSVFKSLCFLALFTPLLNVALKAIWLVPLPRSGPTWYAWPSGHTQEATVVYGWLLVHVRSPYLKVLLGLLLSTICWAIWAAGFHSFPDILSGFGFGILLLVAVHSLPSLETLFFPLSLIALGSLFLLWAYMRIGSLPVSYFYMLALLGALTLSRSLYREEKILPPSDKIKGRSLK